MQKTVTLNPGQSQQVAFQIVPNASGKYDVQLNGLSGQFNVVDAPSGELTIQRFFIVTMPVLDTAYWQAHCDIYNPSSILASGSVHITGELYTNQTHIEIPVDKTFEFTIEPRKTYKCYLDWSQYTNIPKEALCWFNVDTSWGQVFPRTDWTAGFYTGSESVDALSITSSSAIIRYTSRNGGKKFKYVVWSPPTNPDHVIYENCIIQDEYMSIYTTCYWHTIELLSGRQYKVQTTVDARDKAETLFNTPVKF